jgi:hypothetical protein
MLPRASYRETEGAVRGPLAAVGTAPCRDANNQLTSITGPTWHYLGGMWEERLGETRAARTAAPYDRSTLLQERAIAHQRAARARWTARRGGFTGWTTTWSVSVATDNSSQLQTPPRLTCHMLAVMDGRKTRSDDGGIVVPVRVPLVDDSRFSATAACKHMSEGRWRGLQPQASPRPLRHMFALAPGSPL